MICHCGDLFRMKFGEIEGLKRQNVDAANLENFMMRFKDVSFVIDKLEELNKSADNSFAGKFDLDKIGMAWHSYGAITTQVVSGETYEKGNTSFTDKRIKAAVAMSPSGAKNGNDAKISFSSVSIPWLLMTGTKDVSPICKEDVESRLSVFKDIQVGNKFEIVLNKAEHSGFTNCSLPGRKKREIQIIIK
jgi:predicted dienelactone hydrolase